MALSEKQREMARKGLHFRLAVDDAIVIVKPWCAYWRWQFRYKDGSGGDDWQDGDWERSARTAKEEAYCRYRGAIHRFARPTPRARWLIEKDAIHG